MATVQLLKLMKRIMLKLLPFQEPVMVKEVKVEVKKDKKGLDKITGYMSKSEFQKRLMELDLSAAQHAAILREHGFVVIGGPHRGGTTALWRALRTHPPLSLATTRAHEKTCHDARALKEPFSELGKLKTAEVHYARSGRSPGARGGVKECHKPEIHNNHRT